MTYYSSDEWQRTAWAILPTDDNGLIIEPKEAVGASHEIDSSEKKTRLR